MIRSAVLLVRTSLVSVLFLTTALTTLGSVLFDSGGLGDDTSAESLPALTPIVKQRPSETAAVARRSALFDPARRPETVSGSIDDLKPRSGTDTPKSPVSIAGILFDGATRKAMFSVGGGVPAWTSVGADVGGWRVASVNAEGAVIERDGETVALKIADRYKLHAKAAPEQSDAVPAEPQGEPAATPDPAVPPAP